MTVSQAADGISTSKNEPRVNDTHSHALNLNLTLSAPADFNVAYEVAMTLTPRKNTRRDVTHHIAEPPSANRSSPTFCTPCVTDAGSPPDIRASVKLEESDIADQTTTRTPRKSSAHVMSSPDGLSAYADVSTVTEDVFGSIHPNLVAVSPLERRSEK
jgi:hypothetical protein